MAELTRADVGAMVAALGVPATDDDVAEIAYRLNGFLDALAPLSRLPLDSVEPWPTAVEAVEGDS